MARRVKPEAVVWRGDLELPLSQQGMRVLGVPIGQPEFVRDYLERKNLEARGSIPTDSVVECIHQGQFLAESSPPGPH